jgi:hypothetical protein
VIKNLWCKLSSFRRLSRWSKCWFLPVWLLLGAAKICIVLISFRRLAPRLGVMAGILPWVPLIEPSQEARALQIGRVVRLVARYTPWDSNCFPQAVVARLLLGLYGVPYLLAFGLARDVEDRQMKAHAWVAAGRIRVTGGESFLHFTTVGCFVSPLLEDVVKA